MGRRGLVLRFAAVAVVTLVGAGACAFESGRSEQGRELQPAAAPPGGTGANASPAPGQEGIGAPSLEPTAPPTGSQNGPTQTTPPPTRPPTTAPTTPATGGCPQGDEQRRVERYLSQLGGFGAVVVDGRQSAADCKAIKKFQRRYGIAPAHGRAGPTTLAVARRLANTDLEKCDAGKGLTICIDLTHQTLWAVRGGEVVLGPTVTRTGMSGFRTPAGVFHIGWRNIREWSNPYEVWLPYWQQFHGGMGLHETTTYIHNSSLGSHGCVNLLPGDARRLWDMAKVGTRIHLFGGRTN